MKIKSIHIDLAMDIIKEEVIRDLSESVIKIRKAGNLLNEEPIISHNIRD